MMDGLNLPATSNTEWELTSSSQSTATNRWTRDNLRSLFLQFIRYALMGGVAFVVDFALLSGGLALGWHYLLATLLGFVGGLLVNYATCVCWVWRGTQANTVRDLVIFSLIGVGGLLLTFLLMWISVSGLQIDPQIAKLFIAAWVLIWNFSLRRLFVFFR